MRKHLCFAILVPASICLTFGCAAVGMCLIANPEGETDRDQTRMGYWILGVTLPSYCIAVLMMYAWAVMFFVVFR